MNFDSFYKKYESDIMFRVDFYGHFCQHEYGISPENCNAMANYEIPVPTPIKKKFKKWAHKKFEEAISLINDINSGKREIFQIVFIESFGRRFEDYINELQSGEKVESRWNYLPDTPTLSEEQEKEGGHIAVLEAAVSGGNAVDEAQSILSYFANESPEIPEDKRESEVNLIPGSRLLVKKACHIHLGKGESLRRVLSRAKKGRISKKKGCVDLHSEVAVSREDIHEPEWDYYKDYYEGRELP